MDWIAKVRNVPRGDDAGGFASPDSRIEGAARAKLRQRAFSEQCKRGRFTLIFGDLMGLPSFLPEDVPTARISKTSAPTQSPFFGGRRVRQFGFKGFVCATLAQKHRRRLKINDIFFGAKTPSIAVAVPGDGCFMP